LHGVPAYVYTRGVKIDVIRAFSKSHSAGGNVLVQREMEFSESKIDEPAKKSVAFFSRQVYILVLPLPSPLDPLSQKERGQFQTHGL
jgi:hypothetical protein